VTAAIPTENAANPKPMAKITKMGTYGFAFTSEILSVEDGQSNRYGLRAL
jgi:hypothetical protein